MHGKKQLSLGIALALLTAQGCASPGKTAISAVVPPAAATTSAGALSGKVVETMNGGGYTYLCLEKGGQKKWAAIPATAVKVGDDLSLQEGMPMSHFQSKALNRTFESIIFSGGIAGPAAPQGQASPAATAKAAASAAVMSGRVVETMNAGGYTYVCLEKDGNKGWAAIPATEVKVGDDVEIAQGTQMAQFTSKTLKRTFDKITFSSGIVSKK